MLRRLSLFLLLGSFIAAHADSSADLFARLEHASAATTLYAPTLKPWHLKVAFTLYDDAGKNPQQGTFEEWWAGPDQDRITYTSPAFNGTFLHLADARYYTPESSSEPFALETLHNAIVQPLSATIQPGGAVPTIDKVAFGNISLDCMTLTPKGAPVTHPATGLYPTFCFDQGGGDLRFTRAFVTESVVRNSIGQFQGQLVAVALKVAEGQTILAQGKVTTLETAAASSMDFATTGLASSGTALKIPGPVVAGNIVHKYTPRYPESAKQRHVQGDVVLHALIDQDGRIRQLSVISTPDPDLAVAALAAVRQWVYKPYLLKGVPTEVDTTVTVHFRFG